MTRDLHHAIRQLTRARAFSIPAVAALALGLGATTAVFSIVHTVLLSSMGFSDTGRLTTLWRTEAQRGQKHVETAWEDLEHWTAQTDIIETAALVSSVNLDFPLLGDGEPQQVDGATVSGTFFRLLGARPAVGRLLTDDDDRPGAPVRLVISHRLWLTRYGGDPNVAGRRIRAGDTSATIVGVTDSSFDFPRDVDLFVPLQAAWPTVAKQPKFRVFRCVAKLRPGVTPESAQARLTVADPKTGGVLVTPLLDEIYGASRPALWTLFGAVLLVLLIACTNVANLLLARGTVRQRELALRTALGASRKRLIALLLTECVVLAVVASAAGLALAWAGAKVIAQIAPAGIPRIEAVRVDATVLAFGIGLSCATVLLFGLGPALIASKRDPGENLRGGGRSASAGQQATGMRHWLIGAEVTICTVLLVGAGLLIRSFTALASVNPGFNSDHVLTFRITTNTGSQEQRRHKYSQVLERIRALPGVVSAGAVLLRPLGGLVGWDTTYVVQGQSPEDETRNPNGNYQAISPDYFRTMRIRVLAGRDFTSADTEGAAGVVIVNESTARQHWPGGNAVGQSVRLGKAGTAPWLTVVGVAADVRYREWEAVRPDFYVPYTQRAQHRSDFVVRTSGDPLALIPAVQRAVFDVDTSQPISNVTTMGRLVDRTLARSRFTASVLGGFASCALVLAALGIYSVLSFTVARRTAEIGIRMAIGATTRDIIRMVTVGGMAPAVAGAAVGFVAALLLRPAIESLLFRTAALDPVAWAGAGGLLICCSVVACLVPAVRAAKSQPWRSLTAE